MARKNKYYVVTMYRWGNRENHSYVIGVFSTKTRAIKAGATEECWRGNKYIPEVIEFNLDEYDDIDRGMGKVVFALARHPMMGK